MPPLPPPKGKKEMRILQPHRAYEIGWEFIPELFSRIPGYLISVWHMDGLFTARD